MPPTGQDVYNMSDQELATALRELGVDVGPIVLSTRNLYEKKLIKLLTGHHEVQYRYEPVDDDDDDDDDDEEEEEDEEEEIPMSTQTYTETRRRPQRKPSPIRIPDDKEAGGEPSPQVIRRSGATTQSSRPAAQTQSKRGIPLWMKLAAFLVVLILVYLVFKNMEPNAESNIPSQIEAEV